MGRDPIPGLSSELSCVLNEASHTLTLVAKAILTRSEGIHRTHPSEHADDVRGGGGGESHVGEV